MDERRQTNYFAGISFGGEDLLYIDPLQLQGSTITLDIEEFLPALHLSLPDSSRLLSQLTPLDSNLSSLQFFLGKSVDSETITVFDFDTYRRFPSINDIYKIEAFFKVDKFFSPQYCRSHTGSVKQTLTDIALNELGASKVEISETLNFSKTLIQPSWTNTTFIDYLKETLIGIGDEGPYYSFMYSQGTGEKQSTFVFKSLKEFISAPVKRFFTNSTEPYVDPESGEVQYPILSYKAYDNYKMIGVKGCRKQTYRYFNYETSEYTNNILTLDNNTVENDDFLSLSRFHSIDQNDDPDDNTNSLRTGRSNMYTEDFKGQTKNKMHKDIMNLNQLWITTWGFEDLYPGDIIELKFLNEMDAEKLTEYIYNGYWMIQRVIHNLGKQFVTTLLLTRNGIDTSAKQTLVEPVNWKK